MKKKRTSAAKNVSKNKSLKTGVRASAAAVDLKNQSVTNDLLQVLEKNSPKSKKPKK